MLRHLELNPKFIVMTVEAVTMDQPKVGTGFSDICFFLPVETPPIRLEFLLWDLHSLQVGPALEWVLRIRGLFLTILLYHLPLEIKKKIAPFCSQYFFCINLRNCLFLLSLPVQYTIPWNPPTIFHPSLLATIQQKFLRWFCAPLFEQYHSSRIEKV